MVTRWVYLGFWLFMFVFLIGGVTWGAGIVSYGVVGVGGLGCVRMFGSCFCCVVDGGFGVGRVVGCGFWVVWFCFFYDFVVQWVDVVVTLIIFVG